MGVEVEARGAIGVVGGEVEVEAEEGVVVGGAGGADDGGAEEVDVGLRDADEDGVGEVLLEDPLFLHDLLVEGGAGAGPGAGELVVEEVVVDGVGNDVELLELGGGGRRHGGCVFIFIFIFLL